MDISTPNLKLSNRVADYTFDMVQSGKGLIYKDSAGGHALRAILNVLLSILVIHLSSVIKFKLIKPTSSLYIQVCLIVLQ